MNPIAGEAILDHLCREIGGDWLLLGDALVHFAYDWCRDFERIDLVPLHHPTLSRDQLYDELWHYLAREWDLGPKAMNFSGEFFLQALKGWEKQLKSFKTGEAGRVLQPSVSLFSTLKIRSGTSQDLQDVRKALAYRRGHSLDPAILSEWLTHEQLQTLVGLLPRDNPGVDYGRVKDM